jgi:energy-converting hydrogenase Eha subunit H
VVSLVGGLFVSISSVAAVVVKYLTELDFITTSTKNIYLVSQSSSVHDQQIRTTKKLQNLKANIYNRKIKKADVDAIMEEIRTERSTTTNEFYGWSQKFSLMFAPFVDIILKCRKKKDSIYFW